MSSKRIVVDCETDDKLKDCIVEFRRHHKEFNKIHISRNKIISEMAEFYLKN